jgi:hypothetical protein
MPPNDALTARVQVALGHIPRVEQKRMFGGVTFMVRGKMCIRFFRSPTLTRRVIVNSIT